MQSGLLAFSFVLIVLLSLIFSENSEHFVLRNLTHLLKNRHATPLRSLPVLIFLRLLLPDQTDLFLQGQVWLVHDVIKDTIDNAMVARVNFDGVNCIRFLLYNFGLFLRASS